MSYKSKCAGLRRHVVRATLAAGLAGAVLLVPVTPALAEESAVAPINETSFAEEQEDVILEEGAAPVSDEQVVPASDEQTYVEDGATPQTDVDAPVGADDQAVSEDVVVPSDGEVTNIENGDVADPAEEEQTQAESSDEASDDQAEEEATEAMAVTPEPVALQAAASNDAAPLAAPRKGHWEIDARSGKLERYWVWSDGTLAKNELIGPENGAGYYAYAKSDGTIVRGKWDSGKGLVYVAEQNGKLIGSDLSKSGFVVTAIYDGGLQRYWVDYNSKAARSGFYNIPSYGDVFANSVGYITRGDFTFGGRKWSADNDGKLRSGWYVTTGFGDGLQRYWMGETLFSSPHAAVAGRLVSPDKDGSEYYAYAKSDGTIVRGKWDRGNGYVYVAGHDGKLLGSDLTTSGFVVTGEFDGKLQRYWVDANLRAARSGFFTINGYGNVFGLGGEGYLLRGTKAWGADGVILADNDGKLPNKAGWLVTNKFGQGFQRYWIESIYKSYLGAKKGYSKSGYEHYTTAQGYVLRNGRTIIGGFLYDANNDGKLTKSSVQLTAAVKAALNRINGKASATNYLVVIDQGNHRVIIFNGSRNNWMPVADFLCAVGTTHPTDKTFGRTFTGESTIRRKGYIMGSVPYELYWTEFYYGPANDPANGGDDEGQRFHSIPFWDAEGTQVQDGRLGEDISHGCVRLSKADAKYIYDYVPIGSKVVSYN